MAEPVLTLDLLAGARMFAMKPTLRWNIIGDALGVQPVGRCRQFSRPATRCGTASSA